MKDLAKLKNQILDTPGIHPLVAMFMIRLLEADEIQDDFWETADFILDKMKSEAEIKVASDLIYNDCIYSLSTDYEENPVVSKVYDKNHNLKFVIENVQIVKIRNTTVLFYDGIAYGRQVLNHKETWGIISEDGTFVCKPQYQYFVKHLVIGRKFFFIAVDNHFKQGIIDQFGTVYLPFLYREIIAKTNNFNPEFFFYAKIGRKFRLFKFSNPCIQTDEFSRIEKSAEYTYLVKNGKNYGWYNDDLLPILKCEYPKLEVFADYACTHNDILYAVVKDKSGKYGIFHHKKGWLFPCEYNGVYTFAKLDYIVLKKGTHRIFHHFYRKYSIELPNEIACDKITQHTNYRTWYYSALHKKSGVWAVFDNNFNRLTGYYFLHPPEFLFNSKEAMVYTSELLTEHDKLFWRNRKEYKMKVFFDLFGIENIGKKLLPPKIVKKLAEVDQSILLDTTLFKILLPKIQIAGIYYYDASGVVDFISIGDELIYILEPENKHDNLAIALYWEDDKGRHKLGYIPRPDNKKIHELLKESKNLKLVVSEIEENENDIQILFDVAIASNEIMNFS